MSPRAHLHDVSVTALSLAVTDWSRSQSRLLSLNCVIRLSLSIHESDSAGHFELCTVLYCTALGTLVLYCINGVGVVWRYCSIELDKFVILDSCVLF